jgi:prevent-host-death family protein
MKKSPRLNLDNLTISSHHVVMKKAKVSELKSRLSSYLAEVKQGDVVVVCERQTPIARLVRYEDEGGDFRVHESVRPISELGEIRPVRLRRKFDVARILRETRGDL